MLRRTYTVLGIGTTIISLATVLLLGGFFRGSRDVNPLSTSGTTATLARLASLLKRPGLPEQDDINIALQDMTGAQEDDRADVKPLASPAWPIERLPPTNEADVEGMRYLAYSPHSGLHNQRIALENAIVLAQLLNRTLLLPPLRLGKPLRWANNEALQDRLTKPSYVPSSVCSRNRLGAEDYRECTSRRAEFSELSWDWLVDLNGRFEGTDLRLVNRQNLSMAWMTDSVERGGLGVQPKDILTIEDGSRHSYRIYESQKSEKPLDKYDWRLDVRTLRQPRYVNSKILMFGSLFGSTRLILTTRKAKLRMRQSEESMAFANEHIGAAARAVADAMGGQDAFVGVHLRIGEGPFKENAQQTVDAILGRLRELLPESPATHFKVFPRSFHSLKRAETPEDRCRAWRAAHLSNDQTPTSLYIATDARRPLSNRHVKRIMDAYPCTFVLDDFRNLAEVRALKQLRNADDGVRLFGFLLPVLEADIVSRGIHTVGTYGSTFTAFAAGVQHAAAHSGAQAAIPQQTRPAA